MTPHDTHRGREGQVRAWPWQRVVWRGHLTYPKRGKLSAILAAVREEL